MKRHARVRSTYRCDDCNVVTVIINHDVTMRDIPHFRWCNCIGGSADGTRRPKTQLQGNFILQYELKEAKNDLPDMEQ